MYVSPDMWGDFGIPGASACLSAGADFAQFMEKEAGLSCESPVPAYFWT